LFLHTATHNQIKDFNCVAADELREITTQANQADYIFIDEGQFFKGLKMYCVQWAIEGRHVVISALDAYANQELWPEIAAIIPWCTTLQKLNAVCGECGNDASLTIQRPASSFASDEKQQRGTEKIGGAETYEAVCLHCISLPVSPLSVVPAVRSVSAS
jgi:thymidine kinase